MCTVQLKKRDEILNRFNGAHKNASLLCASEKGYISPRMTVNATVHTKSKSTDFGSKPSIGEDEEFTAKYMYHPPPIFE